MPTPVTVAVTGAAGQIAYNLLFSIGKGDMLGLDQPVVLKLLEIPPAMKALEGVAMELNDCAFPLVHGIELSDDPGVAFDGASWALLVGSKPRGKGMERGDLIRENGPIFTSQGEALRKGASDLRVLVVGNPCNTNCLIARHHAPDVPDERWFAMTRLDHNRAIAQLAGRASAKNADVTNVTIWGNHSATQYPDFHHAKIGGRAASDVIGDDAWLQGEFITKVQKRGAEIIEARGKSSAASAANAAVDHAHTFTFGTSGDDWTSAAVVSDGSYDVPAGLISSFSGARDPQRLGDRPGSRHERLFAGETRCDGEGARGREGRGRGSPPVTRVHEPTERRSSVSSANEPHAIELRASEPQANERSISVIQFLGIAWSTDEVTATFVGRKLAITASRSTPIVGVRPDPPDDAANGPDVEGPTPRGASVSPAEWTRAAHYLHARAVARSRGARSQGLGHRTRGAAGLDRARSRAEADQRPPARRGARHRGGRPSVDP